MFVSCVCFLCCVGRGLCDELVILSAVLYRVCVCVCVCVCLCLIVGDPET